MKKSKKHLSRLSAYLKKESSRLEKLISRSADLEDSTLVKGVVSRLSARREIALADLGLVSAAEEALRKAPKAAKTKKAAVKKAPKKVAKKDSKAPRKAPVKTAAKAAAKGSAAKRTVRRKPKAAAPASA